MIICLEFIKSKTNHANFKLPNQRKSSLFASKNFKSQSLKIYNFLIKGWLHNCRIKYVNEVLYDKSN